MLHKVVLRDPEAAQWMVFTNPVDVLHTHDVNDVESVIEHAEQRVSTEELYVAGFLSYEAAPAFDAAFSTRNAGSLPLVCLGLFRQPKRVDQLPLVTAKNRGSLDWKIAIERNRYCENVAEIRRQIAIGNTYQVNYTVRQIAAPVADTWALFQAIATDAPYAACIEADGFAIVSASPELFFELSGNHIVCRPMKGTAARGMTTQEDELIRARLQHSVKDRAENIMIADMVRNDLGRIAVPGSVHATSLFETEKYQTVWQMTSTVAAETEASVSGIFRALFPSASITGAPKVSSMRLIAELEDTPREIYTGCIGYFGPKRQARFNVAIRTVAIDKRRQTAVYGVGGGIVWDSKAEDEYQECLDKASVLTVASGKAGFELLETMLWTSQEGFYLLHEHLERMADSARYFDFTCDPVRVEQDLHAATAALTGGPRRIRLLLTAEGATTVEIRDLHPHDAEQVLRIGLADEPVDPRNPFLYHKTTQRDVYDKARSGVGDCDDVLLWNENGEITETSIANIVLRIDGRLYTPPVSCGLLNGTLRQALLLQGKLAERTIRIDELAQIDEIYLINSVRGWRPAVIDEKSITAR
jgi:para-aminobenzoate synthetase / 4-amino-4-deoxychorismate lyase